MRRELVFRSDILHGHRSWTRLKVSGHAAEVEQLHSSRINKINYWPVTSFGSSVANGDTARLQTENFPRLPELVRTH